MALERYQEPLHWLYARFSGYARRSTTLRRELLLRRRWLLRHVVRQRVKRTLEAQRQAQEAAEDDERWVELYEVSESEPEDDAECVDRARETGGKPRDVLQEFPDLRVVRRPGLDVVLRLYAPGLRLPEGVVEATKLGAAARAPEARLVVAHSRKTLDVVGFALFGFVVRDEAPVLELRRLEAGDGLREHLLQLLERVARYHRMKLIVVTHKPVGLERRLLEGAGFTPAGGAWRKKLDTSAPPQIEESE